jgi:hypothetical protein
MPPHFREATCTNPILFPPDSDQYTGGSWRCQPFFAAEGSRRGEGSPAIAGQVRIDALQISDICTQTSEFKTLPDAFVFRGGGEILWFRRIGRGVRPTSGSRRTDSLNDFNGETTRDARHSLQPQAFADTSDQDLLHYGLLCQQGEVPNMRRSDTSLAASDCDARALYRCIDYLKNPM